MNRLEELVKNYALNLIPENAISLLEFVFEKKMIEFGKKIINNACNLFPTNIDVLLTCLKFEYNSSIISRILSFPGTSYKQAQTLLKQRINNETTNYPETIVKNINNKNGCFITCTMTTCKRLDLFKITMNSFLNCCEDIHLIDKWLFIDDNSSEEDRLEMKTLYPFVTFINKNINEKGHAKSMNMILDNLSTAYVFHLEDDWKFIVKDKYISKCLDIINDDSSFGQCLLNQNYSEREIDYKIIGGINSLTTAGNRYTIHEYCVTEEDKKFFTYKYGACPNCNYWPHYSLRPSLLRTSCLKQIGKYDELAVHFEMEYSYRYYNKGYRSVFMEGVNTIHLGRLTSERFDETKKNAYSLNNQNQFINYKYNTYVINLDRRPDRLLKFDNNIPPKFFYKRIAAVDGSKLQSTSQLQRIFDGNDYNMKVGMVGCALSHIKLWTSIIKSDKDIHIILEDDITFTENFMDKLNKILKDLEENKDWGIVYLGHHIYPKFQTLDTFDKDKVPQMYKKNKSESLEFSAGGTIGYIINKKGALQLLDFINEHGMTNCIDTMQQKAADKINVYYCEPHLIYSNYTQLDNSTNTDIQYDTRSLSIPTMKKIEEKWISLPNDEIKNYKGDDIVYYKSEKNINISDYNIKQPYFIIDKVILVLCPEDNKSFAYVERLKRYKEFNIDDCL